MKCVLLFYLGQLGSDSLASKVTSPNRPNFWMESSKNLPRIGSHLQEAPTHSLLLRCPTNALGHIVPCHNKLNHFPPMSKVSVCWLLRTCFVSYNTFNLSDSYHHPSRSHVPLMAFAISQQSYLENFHSRSESSGSK